MEESENYMDNNNASCLNGRILDTPPIDSAQSERERQEEAAAQLKAIGGQPLAGSGFEDEEFEEGFL